MGRSAPSRQPLLRKHVEERLKKNNKEIPIQDQKKMEDALSRSEVLYRNLFENSPIGMFQCSPLENRLLLVNASFARMLGYESPEEMLSLVTDPSSQINADHQNYLNIVEFLRDHDWFFGEDRLRRKDGGIIIAKVAVRKVLSPDGMFESADGFVEDVTEQRRLETSQREYLEEITDLYENAPCGYHSLSPDGIIIHMNNTELTWLGYSRDEVIGKMKLTDLYSPESKASFQCEFPIFKKQGWLRDAERTFIRKDGSEFHAILNVNAVYDENGNYLMDRASVFDNTERKKVEEALAESEALYRNLFENTAIGMFQTALDGSGFLRINKAYAAMLGYESPEEVISKITDTSTQIHLDPKNRAELLEAVERSGWFYAEQPYLRKDGSIMIGKIAVRKVVKHDGSTAFLEGIVEDITERKRAEQALIHSERELRSKAQNLADVNTTLKVLLNTIEKDQEKLTDRFLDNIKTQVIPYLEKLEKSPLNDAQKGFIGAAKENLDKIASPFVQKLTSRYLHLTKKEIQIAGLVKEGKTSKEIAEILNSTKRVIEFHRENIRKKLGLNKNKQSLAIFLRSFS